MSTGLFRSSRTIRCWARLQIPKLRSCPYSDPPLSHVRFKLRVVGHRFNVWLNGEAAFTTYLPFPHLRNDAKMMIWTSVVLGAADQLRHRIAFALSQILVIGEDGLEKREEYEVYTYRNRRLNPGRTHSLLRTTSVRVPCAAVRTLTSLSVSTTLQNATASCLPRGRGSMSDLAGAQRVWKLLRRPS